MNPLLTLRTFVLLCVATLSVRPVRPSRCCEHPFEDQAHLKTINQIQVLDVAGDVTWGNILR
ncbi:MAG: hypothetical protein JNN07_06255 [Verrucomicrobiales bacterium]|nr:hypothetical protein [Verrucomicrobiales bacterium]